MPKTDPEPTIAETFELIAATAIADAENVDCSLSDFVDGLKNIETDLRERRTMAEHELSQAQIER